MSMSKFEIPSVTVFFVTHPVYPEVRKISFILRNIDRTTRFLTSKALEGLGIEMDNRKMIDFPRYLLSRRQTLPIEFNYDSIASKINESRRRFRVYLINLKRNGGIYDFICDILLALELCCTCSHISGEATQHRHPIDG